mmetsp:Transcript_85998/g.223535  ORF Transcript_85998/g.223535 Transcript_85998/m.223535 type:complete len:557 (+) Transcript_85998:79-1749(+)|eukprot:CAMPEP_0115211208 /NCGR_PEP_ID=MMETSP0270-20121206/22645_1 /TAXON_ID=71861 /ORGANISM="Scrippsiella trochoidea, Strain CCMP3099" /LENGTH=556 /DNA_ID=CAMNT_0002624889 /DNA_START=48 /DNA_END=1718 /DNA_ORIENTATION=+
MAPPAEASHEPVQGHVGVRAWAHQKLNRLTQGCTGGHASVAALSHEAFAAAAAERASHVKEHPLNPQAFMPQHVNTQISKRYKINKREIGAGSCGKVLVAEDREIKGRLVAIKKVSALRGTKRQEFEKEVSVMKLLDHPNICKLLETYDEGKAVFLVMEYCDGGELLDLIMNEPEDADGGLSEDLCADIIQQIVGALEHAHARGVAHRDLKPENVCLIDASPGIAGSGCMYSEADLRPRKHVKVIDWGVSGYFCRDLMLSDVGTVPYVAPEVLTSTSGSLGYTFSCDIWGLGVLTYVTLSGTLPFEGSNPTEQAHSIIAGRFSFDGAVWSHVSSAAKDFISSCLSLDPSTRPTAAALLEQTWLKHAVAARRIEGLNAKKVLRNLRQSSLATFPVAAFAAFVARQLDHQSLRGLPRLFRQLDLNGDGELDLSEFKSAFQKIFGRNSKELIDIERSFELLDLSGSGTINYTEFIAAALGDRVQTEESLKAAFKAFDVQDNRNHITKTDFEQVVASLNLDEEADRVFSEFDVDGDGALDYEEWKAWVRMHIIKGCNGGG